MVKRRRPSTGFILAFVLICLTVVTITLAAMIGRMSQGHRQVMMRQRQVQVQWLAESAIDRAATRLHRDDSYRGETWQLSPEAMGSRWSAHVTIHVESSEPGNTRFVHVTVVYSRADLPGIRYEKQVPVSKVKILGTTDSDVQILRN
jgi:type II secretory pathway pseudopilin PulG